MPSFKLSIIAALVALLPLHAFGADAAPSKIFAGKLSANQALATAAGTQVTGVSDWSVRREGDMTLFESPEGDARVGIIDTTSTDAKSAIKAAWARMGGPNAKLEPKTLIAAPARTGWDERVVADYDIPSDNKMHAQAIALRRGSAWTVYIIDAAIGTLGKRSAAVSLMRSSLVPADFKPEDFAGRKPNRLDAARIGQMQAFLSQAMQDLGVPGLGYALLDGGKIVYEGGLGVRTLGKPAAVDANTLFMAASNTKGMSTLLLATLADDGKLRWDQPVSQLYPSFKLGSADTTAKVQVKHLVCACTGLPRHDMEWMFEFRKASALDSIALLGKTTPTSGFGELYQYNNLMASAAGYIGANLIYPKMELGRAYDKAMQERIFKPLGMLATTFDSQAAMRGNHASPHATRMDNQVVTISFDLNRSIYPHRPSGGVWTSAHDFARYVQLEANAGKLPSGKQLVSAENLLMRRAPQVASGKDKTYGMGLINERTAGIDVVLHGGSMFGYMSNFFLIPESGTGVVLLTNSDEGVQLLRPALRRLIEIMYDAKLEAAEDVSGAAKRTEASRMASAKLITMPPDTTIVATLAKHYRSAELGDLWVRHQGKTLLLDAGEWKVPFGTRKDATGKATLVSVAPEMDFELNVATHEGRRALLLQDAQHEYQFIEVK